MMRSTVEGHRSAIVIIEYHVRSLEIDQFTEKLLLSAESYLEIVLNRLDPFASLAGFERGALACPFVPFLPGSTSRPLLSAAILYGMQLSTRVRPALRVV